MSSIELDYTDCGAEAPTGDEPRPMPTSAVKTYWRYKNISPASKNYLWKKTENVTFAYNNFNVSGLTNCTLQFRIEQDMPSPVRTYYHLENFYQNHRRYVNSYFPDQLLAKNFTMAALKASNCAPLAVENETHQIYPCGLIANSIFNDTIGQPVRVGVSGSVESRTYNWSEKGIAWESDMELYKPLENPNYDVILPPPDWRVRYPDGRYSEKYPPPNIKTDEHFVTWMRTAALPSFFKPWAFGSGTLENGTYKVDIVDSKYLAILNMYYVPLTMR